MVFSMQDDWSRLPYPPPGYLPSLGIKPVSFMSPALADRLFTTSGTWEDPTFLHIPFQRIIQFYENKIFGYFLKIKIIWPKNTRGGRREGGVGKRKKKERQKGGRGQGRRREKGEGEGRETEAEPERICGKKA